MAVFKRKRRIKRADGRTVVKQSSKWYVKYRDGDGVVRCVPGYTDKEATKQMAARLAKEAALAQEGVVDRYKEHRTRPLKEHLEDFRKSLLAKGNTAKHAKLTFSRAAAVIDGCRFAMWGDISASKVEQFLAGLRDGGNGVGAKTSNYYLQSIKQFCRWLVQDGRANESPLKHLQKKKTAKARQRALEPNEVRRLLETAQATLTRFNMAGGERAMLYRIAVESGLRANELRSLTVSSFDLANRIVSVKSTSTKNKNEAILPLRASTALELKAFFANKMPHAKAFTLPSKYNMAKMLRKDMEDAGLSCSDDTDSDDYVNFHSLRHTTGSLLAAAGVHPKVIQAIMRHSDINLTMGVYTHTLRGQETQAIESLPDLSLPSTEAQKVTATGTDGSTTLTPVLTPQLTPQLTPKSTPTGFPACTLLSANDTTQTRKHEEVADRKSGNGRNLDTKRTDLTPVVVNRKESRPAGLEPAAYGLEIRCSIQLSYGRPFN